MLPITVSLTCCGWRSNGYLEPAELAAFMRRLVRGMTAREQHYLLMHLAGMDVTGMGTVSFQVRVRVRILSAGC